MPTKKNRERQRLQKEIRDSIRKIIDVNDQTKENSKNLLSFLLLGDKNQTDGKGRLGVEDVIDECKTFYFAGKETTANALTWAVLLLSFHQEWQIKAREEVHRVCKQNKLPTAEHLNDFKIVSSSFCKNRKIPWTLL